MKRNGDLFAGVCRFDSLHRAFRRALKGSGRSEEACRFAFHLERRLFQLAGELEAETYRPAPYRYFRIFDPKERTISVAPFRDRVVHHALVAAVEPVFERAFIRDSYATRRGKGTHKAVRRAQAFLRRHRWYLKLDVAKYFDSIDHGVLLALVARKIKDPGILRLCGRIVANSDDSRGLAAGKGLPIGNLTSQFLANVYLDPFDHFIKERLRVGGYLRYMDDMVLLADSRSELKRLYAVVAAFLAKHLQLALNPSVTLLNRTSHGLPFLGFRIFPNLVRIRPRNLRRMRERIALRSYQVRHGRIGENEFSHSLQSVFAHLAFADSLGLRRDMAGA